MNSSTSNKRQDREYAGPGVASQAATQVVNSRDLLDGRRMLVIRHGVEEYRLHLTRGGKLILTK